jgi:protease-4
MAKFLAGFVTGILLVFLSVVLLIFAALKFREKPPQIADNSVLVLRLDGEVPERPPVELPAFLTSERSALTVAGVWTNLRKAAADSHIKALVVEPEGLEAGWGKLEEIRSDIAQFRKSGKRVYAYLRAPSTRDYYVALAADHIYLGHEEPLMLKGVRAEIMYFKKTLDKIGVSVDVEHAGKYKDFGDMFTRTDMSPETREVTNSLVESIYGNLVGRIAEARKKSPAEIQAIIDTGPFTAQQAQRVGLVDGLRFEDEVWGEIKKDLNGKDAAKVSIAKYMKVPLDSVGIQGKSRIALVVGQGDIVRGDSENNGADETSLTSYGFDKILNQVAADSGIKGVIVRIDSPGGEVTASDDIWRQMNLLSKKKPTVISMSDVAASGGYYMAMTGDPIIAYPGTLTGSIGVVFGKPDLHGLYDKLGITKDAVQRGKHADIDSDYTALSPDEREVLRRGIDESYQDFIGKVAAARHRTNEDVDRVAQGRVWLGSQAKSNGLVDELGGLDTAIQQVKKKAGIPESEQIALTVYPPRRSLFDLLMKKSEQDALETELTRAFGHMPYHAWMRGGFLRIMPYWITVK